MNIVIEQTPIGYQAYDDDVADFAPDAEWPANCIGYGPTRQEAADDLCEQTQQWPIHVERAG